MNLKPGQLLVFIVFCVLFIFALFFRTSIAIIVEDLTREFDLPAAALGLMSSTFFYAYALLQLPVGILSDRIGVRKTVLFFGLLGVAGSLLFASSSGAQSATWGRMLTGAGTAGIWIPALKYLSLNFHPHIFATLSSIISAVGCLGLMLSTLPLALLVEARGWRFPFFLAAALMFLLVIAAWHLMGRGEQRRASASTGASPDRETPAGKTTPAKGEAEAKADRTDQATPEKPFWRHPAFWYFAFWAFLFYGTIFSFNGLWGAAYLQDTFKLSREAAGAHLLFLSIGLLLGSLFWGFLSDRFVRARRPLVLAGTGTFFLLWGAPSFMYVYPGTFLMSLLYFLLGLCGMVFLLVVSSSKEYFPLRTAGAAMGAVNSLMLGGVAVFQGITGYLLGLSQAAATVLPYRVIFIFYFGAISIAFFLALLMPETFPGKTKKPALPENYHINK